MKPARALCALLALLALVALVAGCDHGRARVREASPSAREGARRRPRAVVIAHRGGAGQWPEETLLAYASARAEGEVWLDGDVRLSADGVPVLIHDDTVDRTTDGTGRVDAMTLAALRALDAGYCFSPERDPRDTDRARCHAPAPPGVRFPYRGHAPRLTIPTLDELLDAVPASQPVTLELKSREPFAARAVARRVRAHGRVGTTCVGAFDDDVARALRSELPEGCVWAPRSAYECEARGGERAACGDYRVLQVPTALDGAPLVTAEFVRRAHAAGRVVQVWTVDEPAEMDALLAAGVDAIFTDYPARLRARIAR